MTEERSVERPDDADPAAYESIEGPLDLTVLVAVHRGLRRDLSHFVHGVLGTPVDERDTWQALSERWVIFSSYARHHHQWERSSLWPLVIDGARRVRDDRAAVVVGGLVSAAAVAERLIESCHPVFARLAAARDEDAAATLRVRVQAASTTLTDTLDDEDAEGLPLLLQYVPPVQWRAAVRSFLSSADPHTPGWEGLPWLVHQLPVQAAAVMAAEWGVDAPESLLDDTAAFRRLEATAFPHSTDVAG